MRTEIYERMEQMYLECKHSFRMRDSSLHEQKLSDIPFGDWEWMEINFDDEKLLELFEYMVQRYYRQG